MFGELINEVKISVLLHTKSPLTIRSNKSKLIEPAVFDMQCIKSRYQGKDTVIIPGSTLKGVLRSRYEKISGLFGEKCCNIFDKYERCGKPKDWDKRPYKEQGAYVYKNMCPACKLFGSLDMASRIYIPDTYPEGECVMGGRKGVAINRITGASHKSALYDFEVVEEGKFRAIIRLKNYELYQMALVLFVLKDLDEGYVSLGASSTRGNGRMEIQEMDICFREYRQSVTGLRGVTGIQEIPLNEKYNINYNWELPFFGEMCLQGISIDEMIENCKDIDIKKDIRRG